ncbi:MAG TPA: anti-sigma factor [Marmoricola sp.]
MNEHDNGANDTQGSIHALSGAYAVDALDDLERARFETHLATCADCRAEVAGLREAAARLAETSAVSPPPTLRDKILTDISRVRPLPPKVPHPEGPQPAAPQSGTPAPTPTKPHLEWRHRWPRLLAAVAAVLAVVGIGTVVAHPWTHGASQGPVSVADRVLRASDAQRISERLPGSAHATVVRSASQARAVILTRGLPPAPSGRVYELWLQDPSGRMLPAGLMRGGSRTVVLNGDAATAKAAGITVEPAGGSPQPTSAPIALFDFSKARA